MNHQGQLQLDSPTNLLLESQQLFLFELSAPIVVEADFADGEGSLTPRPLQVERELKQRMYRCQLVAPVGTDLLRMQSEHGTAVVRILGADVEDGVARRQVDGG